MVVFATLTLLASYLVPLGVLLMRRDFAFLPGVVYGLAVCVYLIAGMPFLDNPYGGDAWYVSYFSALLVASIPMWTLVLLPTPSRHAKHIVVDHNRGDVTSFYLLWLICLIGVAIFQARLGATPFMLVLLETGGSVVGSASALLDIRLAATYIEDFSRVRIFYYVLPPLIALFGHVLYRQGRIGYLSNVLSITLAALLTVQFLHKSQLIFLVFQLFLLDMYLTRVSLRRLAILSIVAFALLIGMYAFYSGYIGAPLVLGLLRRIFVVYVETMEFVLANWPTGHEFYWGMTFPNPGGMLPYDPVYFGGVLFELIYGGRGSSPVSAIGEGYVNFGLPGVLIMAALIGAWVTALVTFFAIARHDAFWLAVWTKVAVDVNAFGSTSFFVAVDISTIAVIAIMAILTMFVRGYLSVSGNGRCYDAN